MSYDLLLGEGPSIDRYGRPFINGITYGTRSGGGVDGLVGYCSQWKARVEVATLAALSCNVGKKKRIKTCKECSQLIPPRGK